jgi:hypothetical protein
MRSDIKFLGLGLTIGISIAGLAITGLLALNFFTSPAPVIPIPPVIISSTPTLPIETAIAETLAVTKTPTTIPNTDSPTFTVTPTAARTDTPTSTPSPTATLTVAEQMIVSGDLFLTGPLTRGEQIRLYESSIQFISPTTKESKVIGEALNGVGYGSPTLICGPLSLAIMQGAGLIEYQDVIPYDFWLLNPYISKDRALINRVFPEEKYENTLFKTPLNQFDWRSYPLHPGDFLFIRHGTGGNFDHMLVVNRVDSQGRVYAVTNYYTPDGYIINEALLYGPNDFSIGLFAKWTEKQNSITSSTGFGGFEIWRQRMP